MTLSWSLSDLRRVPCGRPRRKKSSNDKKTLGCTEIIAFVNQNTRVKLSRVIRATNTDHYDVDSYISITLLQ